MYKILTVVVISRRSTFRACVEGPKMHCQYDTNAAKDLNRKIKSFCDGHR